VKGFRRGEGDLITARFNAGEAAAIAGLAKELAGRLSDGDDPAVARLFPDAYPDDEEASAEFRRFTVDSLTDAKIENARLVVRSLAASGHARVTVELDPGAAQSWLRALTDIRLVMASQLGIEHDGDTGFRGGPVNRRNSLVYAWLGYVQESLIQSL
jgi:hypothetical protein